MIKFDYFKHDDSPVVIVYCLLERVMHVKQEMNGKEGWEQSRVQIAGPASPDRHGRRAGRPQEMTH